MDNQISKIIPDYHRIYSDIIEKKYPYKMRELRFLLQKKELNTLDIIKLNERIFGQPDKNSEASSRKYRSYRKSDVLQILEYQRKHNLGNSQLAKHFKLSRNTIAKWKKYSLGNMS